MYELLFLALVVLYLTGALRTLRKIAAEDERS